MKVDINAVYGHTGGTPLPPIYTDYAEGLPMAATTKCTPLNPYVVMYRVHDAHRFSKRKDD